ncbi:uncharacterized protein LOC127759882 [Oryza glaberrima]|uniref:Uncharacterized protein n=1 Tax=Oryza barthii TaxID=65489 RepID=A0A0D3ELT1_9ORYZ|nr:uncharacterized protein LOC127759882 [Oryza glaberrima]
MPLNLALCCARGRGAYCCPPPGDHPAPPLRVDAAAADGGGDWCCYEELPVSTPPHVPRGLARGGEDEDEDDDDGLELTMTRGAPGVRDDADDQQLVSPAAAAAGGVGFVAKSWIASVYERLSRTFSVLP